MTRRALQQPAPTRGDHRKQRPGLTMLPLWGSGSLIGCPTASFCHERHRPALNDRAGSSKGRIAAKRPAENPRASRCAAVYESHPDPLYWNPPVAEEMANESPAGRTGASRGSSDRPRQRNALAARKRRRDRGGRRTGRKRDGSGGRADSGLHGPNGPDGDRQIGHVARKVSATLCSLGTPSLFLHTTEAIHGDLGQIMPGEVVILISAAAKPARSGTDPVPEA